MTRCSWHDARMTTDDARRRLGDLVAARRKELGLSKEAAARLAGISSITWKRIEDGAEVRDAKYASASAALGWEPDAMELNLKTGRIPRGSGPAEDFLTDAPDPVIETMLETIRAQHPDWVYAWAARVVEERRANRSATKRNNGRAG